MKIKKPLLVALVCVALVRTVSFAQIKTQGLPFISNYTTGDYNASTVNWSIEQDDRGIMYFANNNGILEFDGASWKLTTTANGAEVRSLSKDGNGRIYVGGRGNLGFIQKAKQGLTKFHSLLPALPDQERDFNNIWKIIVTDEGTFFISDDNIYIYKNYFFKQILRTESHNQFSSFINHKFYTLEKDIGVVTFNNNKLQPVPGGRQFGKDNLRLILRYSHDQLLFAFENAGFMIYDGQNFMPFKVEKGDEILKNKPHCGINYGIDNIIIGTEHSGIYILKKNGQLLHHINSNKGLNSDKVYDIFEDKDRDIWLALENGIAFLELNSPFTLFSENTGIKGKGLSSLVLNNKLYLGTTQGLYEADWGNDSSDAYEEMTFKYVENSAGPVYFIERETESLLFGQHDGTFELSPDHTIKQVSDNWGALRMIRLEKDKNLYIQGTYNGLAVFIRSENGDLRFRNKIEGYGFETSFVEEESDTSNILWVGEESKGLWRLYLDEDYRTVLKKRRYGVDNYLPRDTKNKVFKIHRELLFTTEKGVYRFDAVKNKFYPDTAINNAIGAVYVNRIFQDQKANIWIELVREETNKQQYSYELALLKKRGQSENSVHSSEMLSINNDETNISGYEVHINELLKLKGKNLDYVASIDPDHVLLGMEEGFVHYYLDFEKNYKAPFNCMIRRVECLSLEYDSLIFGGMFERHDGTIIIKQPHDQRHISGKKQYVDSLRRHLRELEVEIKALAESKGFSEDPRIQGEYVRFQEEKAELDHYIQGVDSSWGKNYHQFSPDMNALRFTYASNFFENCNKTKYQVYLKSIDGKVVDKGWSSWSTQSSKEYTNLPSGRYEFNVRAQNIYGNISDTVKYEFEIRRPWHESWWLQTMEIAFLMLIMIVSYYLNRRLKLYKVSFVLTLLVIISIFEFIVEKLEIYLADYSGGIFFFTLLMNIALAMSLSPIEHAIRKRLRRSQLNAQKEEARKRHEDSLKSMKE